MKDYYQILGVPDSADEAAIKKAYRNLAKKYHPDANPGNKAAENKFKEVSEAHEVLSNKQKRAQYDQMRRYGAGGGFGGFGGFEGGGRPRRGAGTSQEFNYDDLSSMFGEFGGFGSFADIFSSIFGESLGAQFGGTATRTRRPMAGEDLSSEIDVPADVAMIGGRVNLRLNVTEQCPTCHGSGAKPGSHPRTCPECHGRGVISFTQGNFAVSRPCPRCLGRGQIIDELCPTCKGAGSIRKGREIAVKIPPGIQSGKTIRLRGLGNPGANGGPSGDLYLRINIVGKPGFEGQSGFWREGLDIHFKASITSARPIRAQRFAYRRSLISRSI